MRFSKFFCNNESIGKLLSQFPHSQGQLFHYTNQAASIGISGGEIWMTRADCFLDKSEIAHGVNVLSEAAQTTLREDELASFSSILNVLRARLRACFVLSLSQDSNNDYLKSVYAGEGGAILEFREDFPIIFHSTSWHSIPNGDDSWGVHLIANFYEFFEGFVVYDSALQLELAKAVCQTYRNIQSSDAHFVDKHHFIDSLIKCLVLFKAPKFEVEKEYRFSLIRNQKSMPSFEETRGRDGKRHAFIKVQIPCSDAPRVCARDIQR